jgi:hypothetical protein
MDVNDEFIVNPNAGKEFVKSLLTIFVLVIIIIGVLLFLQAQVGLGFVLDIFSAFDIQTSATIVTLTASLIFVAGAAILLLFNYMNIRNQKYAVYNDRIDFTGTEAFLFLHKEVIPFQNITRITFSNDGIMNKLLSCGEVKLELSGLKIPSILLESIDGPDRLTELIQQKINQYNMQKQMQYQEQTKIEGIMRKF